jgi:hypothetical protein
MAITAFLPHQKQRLIFAALIMSVETGGCDGTGEIAHKHCASSILLQFKQQVTPAVFRSAVRPPMADTNFGMSKRNDTIGAHRRVVTLRI